jgi:hypothetical protein
MKIRRKGEIQKRRPQSKREASTQFPLQMCKSRLINEFGQNVSKLLVGNNMAQINVAFLTMITKKVKANINVLGLRMKHRIPGNTYGTRAITK